MYSTRGAVTDLSMAVVVDGDSLYKILYYWIARKRVWRFCDVKPNFVFVLNCNEIRDKS